MDKLSEVTEYVEHIKMKKTLVGGYDKKDVSQKIAAILELFKKCTDKYEAEEAALIADYEKRMEGHAAKNAELRAEILDLNKEVQELKEELSELSKGIQDLKEKHADEISMAEKEKEKLKTAYKECCSSILTEYSESIRSLSVEFTHVLENVARLQRGLKENVIFEQLGVADEE